MRWHDGQQYRTGDIDRDTNHCTASLPNGTTIATPRHASTWLRKFVAPLANAILLNDDDSICHSV
jgi:hypothetical protein